MNSLTNNPAAVNKDFLIIENRENARKLARRILNGWGATVSKDSLESLVDFSLCKAADNFSPKHGAGFLSYFFYYLRGDLAKEVKKRTRQTRIKAVANCISRAEQKQKFTSELPGIDEEKLAAGLSTFTMPKRPDTPEDQLLAREEAQILQDEYSELDMRQRQVLQCVFLEGQKVKDVAKQIGCSERLVFILKNKALKTLRSIFTGIVKVEDTPSGSQLCIQARRSLTDGDDIRPYFYSRRNLVIPKIKKKDC